ncbi:MAG: tRNA-dihydrouridine synthase [Candidatus Doudnabacteria bacterium]|nr:tRNA-dihydrouridine synthase [Candidatus Doudnabacteria bacterium]
MNFWQTLPKPIFALAPMADVTDCAFREIFARYGKNPHSASSLKKEEGTAASSPLLSPLALCGGEIKTVALPRGEGLGEGEFVMFTEFVNVDGLLHPTGFERLKVDLEYTEAQRPIVAQIWGRDPEKFYQAAKIIAGMRFDGIDINFGCPQDKEISQKTCAALIREPELAGEIIDATIKGADTLPVSVKTRLGYSKASEMQDWLSDLLKYPLAAITIHARTKQEKSKVPARWEKITEAVKIRDSLASQTLIIGNGDIKTRGELFARISETKADGAMIGRGAFGNPWIFRRDGYRPSIKERMQVMLEHAELFEKIFAGTKSFINMRKNFKAYTLLGFNGVGELRVRLMKVGSAQEAKTAVDAVLRQDNL